VQQANIGGHETGVHLPVATARWLRATAFRAGDAPGNCVGLVPIEWCAAQQVASKIDPADKSTIEKAVDETVEWLDANQLAEVRARSACHT